MGSPEDIYHSESTSVLSMFAPFEYSQLRGEFEEPIAVWNASPAIRFGAVLFVLSIIWSLLVPTESVPLTVTVLDTLFSGLFLLAHVSFFIGLLEQRNGNGNETPQSRPRPGLRFETCLWSGKQESVSHPQRPTDYRPAQEMSAGSMSKRYVTVFIWMFPLLWLLWVYWRVMTTFWGTPAISEPGWLLIIGVIIAVSVVHEAFHALVAALYGCQISAGVVVPFAAFIRPSGTFLFRNERICIGIAPTIAITIITSLLIFHVEGWIVTAAFWALLLNTAGAGSDFYNIWKLLKVPSKRLYYVFPDCDPPTLVYDHVSQSDSTTFLERIIINVKILTDSLKVKPP
jgi:hypothetical protein